MVFPLGSGRRAERVAARAEGRSRPSRLWTGCGQRSAPLDGRTAAPASHLALDRLRRGTHDALVAHLDLTPVVLRRRDDDPLSVPAGGEPGGQVGLVRLVCPLGSSDVGHTLAGREDPPGARAELGVVQKRGAESAAGAFTASSGEYGADDLLRRALRGSWLADGRY